MMIYNKPKMYFCKLNNLHVCESKEVRSYGATQEIAYANWKALMERKYGHAFLYLVAA